MYHLKQTPAFSIQYNQFYKKYNLGLVQGIKLRVGNQPLEAPRRSIAIIEC